MASNNNNNDNNNNKSSYGEFANQITGNKEREWRRNVSSMPPRAARNILLS